MGRGKIEIKLIENQTNRQVTYSKRRNGIVKKAKELTVLCDAQVCLIMQSSTDRIHEYTSPTTTVKKMVDLYQKNLQIDLWSSHYEAMEKNLWKLKEVNNKLRTDIRQRYGQDLDGLSITELVDLENKIEASVKIIRERKYHVIKNQTNTTRKKVKNLEEINSNLMHGIYEGVVEDPQYGYVDNDGDYESAVALANGASNLYFFNRVHNNNNNNPNLNHNLDQNPDNGHRGGSGNSLMSSITHLHDLRLG